MVKVISEYPRRPGKSTAHRIMAGAKVGNMSLRNVLMLRFEIVSDGKEISCIIEGADDQYCGHGQTPESAMVDLFGKLGAI